MYYTAYAIVNCQMKCYSGTKEEIDKILSELKDNGFPIVNVYKG